MAADSGIMSIVDKGEQANTWPVHHHDRKEPRLAAWLGAGLAGIFTEAGSSTNNLKFVSYKNSWYNIYRK